MKAQESNTKSKEETKMTKTTKADKAATKADLTREAAAKAVAEMRKSVRGTALYGKIKDAVGKAIEGAAAEGLDGLPIPVAKIPGELGSPDSTVGEAICACENPRLVADTLAEDLESDGYKVLRLFGCPIAVAWPKPDAE